MTERVSKVFAQSENGLLHHGLIGLTGQLSCPLCGLLQHFSKAISHQMIQFPGMLWPLLITLHSLYSYLSQGPEHFGQGLPVVHAPSTHPECYRFGAIPYVGRIEPLLLTSGIHPQGGFGCSPHPVFCWHCDLPFPRYTIVCDFDFQMNNDNEEDKKKKIHLIFSVNKIHFVLLPFSSSLLWAFTDSRICYQVLVGNSSALFTVSAGDTITSYNLNSWHFFSVCLSFSISNLPSCLHFLDGEHMDIQTTFETNLIAYPSCARILSMCARQGVVFR